MMRRQRKPLRRLLAGAALVGALAGSSPPGQAAETDASSPAVAFSSDPKRADAQRGAYEVVHRYEQLLNAGDTAGILVLYAPDGVAEWNDKPTFVTRDEP